MRTIIFTLAANQAQSMQEIAGSYFEVIEAPATIARIDWVDSGGQQLEPWTGVQAGWFAEDPYRAFAITNGATPQTIKVMVGRNRGGNRAAPINSLVKVQEQEGAYRQTVDGRACMGMGVAPAVAAQLSMVTIGALATATGRTVSVNKATFLANVASTLNFMVIADSAITAAGAATTGAPHAKKFDAAAAGWGLGSNGDYVPSGQIRKANAAAFGGGSQYGVIHTVPVAANTSTVVEFREPLILAAGTHLAVQSGFNTQLQATFEWVEQ
jgi:hypothetical protein